MKSAPRSISLAARNAIRDARHPALDGLAKGLLHAIASRLDEEGRCWPDWRTLAADCMDDRNSLTQDVRAKIISLSLWVSKYSRSVTREKAPLDPLIEINRTIMQGLQAS